MKRIILSLVIIVLSCKKELKKGFKNENSKFEKSKVLNEKAYSDSLNKRKTSISIKDSILDVNYIISKTSKFSRKINVKHNYTQTKRRNRISKSFLSKYITPHNIDFGFPDNLPSDYPESYCFQEFKEYPNFNLFTFTYDDESCCKTLYAATTRKDRIEIISIGVIGYEGGDGGWSGKKYGEWYSDYGLSSTEISNYKDPLEDSNEIETDTIWSEVQLNNQGILNYIEHHKVKYIGNKQIE